jgi:topoisomerase-4 subunit B
MEFLILKMSNTIQVLEEIEHIRTRPGMYTNTENMNHVFSEIFDNALDELTNGFATDIFININGLDVSISDNGRGIPIHDITLPDGSIGDSIIIACTKLFSGSKFNENNYKFKRGLNGVGLVVVNALSNVFIVTVKENDKYVRYFFEDSKFKNKQIFKCEDYPNIKFSTLIEFSITPKYFKNQSIDFDLIGNRLKLINSKFENANIFLNGEKIKNNKFEKFCKEILDIKEDIELNYLSFEDVDEQKIELMYNYENNSKMSPTVIGDVNLLFCSGTYLTNIQTLFFKVIGEIINDERLTKTDVLNQLRIYCSLTIKDPEFQGQQKEKFGSDVSAFINKLYFDLKTNLNTFSIKERFKKILDEKDTNKALKIIQKTKSKRLSSDNPIKDCLKLPGEVLYLLEGESACGTLNGIRNRDVEAILPLTGKIRNTINKNISESLESSKVKFLLEAIGIGQPNFRFKKVKVVCDGDPDGLHISTLVSVAIWKFVPKLIEDGNLIIILPPLYGGRKKDKPFVPIYNLEESEKYRSLGYEIKRFKGLGEMQKNELEEIIYKNPLEYVVQIPKGEEAETLVKEALVNTELKRIICSDSRFGLQQFIQKLNKEN